MTSKESEELKKEDIAFGTTSQIGEAVTTNYI